LCKKNSSFDDLCSLFAEFQQFTKVSTSDHV